MELSRAYNSTKVFWVVSYEDGHGTIELYPETFTRKSYAEKFIQKHAYSEEGNLTARAVMLLPENWPNKAWLHK